jgi:O-antigen/teichoic acid export membrane protein
VIGNLLLIPHFGYLGAACITIFSEFSLLFPFYYSVKRNVGVVPWFSICLRPALALVITGIATYGLTTAGLNVWLAVGLGLLIYAGLLALTGALRGNDMELVWQALPLPFLRNRGLNEAGS